MEFLKLYTSTLEETLRIGSQLGSCLVPGDVVGLNGPLGVGKTTLVKGLAQGLKIDPRFEVSSPTYVFVHVYEGPIPLFHIDLYRVSKEEELPNLGFDEMLGTQGVAVIEWFDRFPHLWHGEGIQMTLSYVHSTKRRLELKAKGSRAKAILEKLGEGYEH